ncbi:extracellular solute-binding protein [Iocasia frigidifontis]|uniref:Extracellular solute-binding protein n=1 Tax=Iocasia fonsfrigidae TaxID=2682810 RepID=A0A8A7KB33_9FIRM|nr:extracellular solute-binding protein [Iocasia fonsfrigidae]QTL97295.1 extracellular solute-binding protein [Iocasia fonsfrigidae]
MTKKILVSCLVLLLVLSCTIGVAAEKVTLRFSWWGSQDRHDRTMKVIELFEEKYPDIDIQPEFTGWSGYWDRINTQMAGGNLPDIVQHVRKYISGYVKNENLLNLTPYLKDGTLDTSNIPDSLVAMGNINGRQYGVATGVNAPAVYYDKGLFKKAGISYPSPDRTWQDEVALIKKLHDKLGILGSANLTSQTDVGGFTVWVRQHGGALYNEDGTALGYDDDQIYIDFMEMTLDVLDSGAVWSAPERAENADTGVEQDPITRQEAAMATIYWSNQLGALVNSSGKMLGITTMPKLDNQLAEGRFLKPAMLLTVSANTEHPKEAITFLNFWLHDIEAGKILGTDRGVPTESKVKAVLKEDASEIDQAVFDYIDLAAANAGEALAAQPPAYQEVVAAYEDVYWKVIYKQITPEEGAKEFREKANSILANQ